MRNAGMIQNRNVFRFWNIPTSANQLGATGIAWHGKCLRFGMSEDEIEAAALAEHESMVGKILLASVVDGYEDDDNCRDFACDPPARVRVMRTARESVLHWNDDWLDPYWDVELVEPHPVLKGVRSMWVFGTSYNVDGCGKEPTSSWKAEGVA